MAQLTADTQLVIEDLEGMLSEFVIDDSATAYEGAAIGLNASTKKVRQLVAGD